jgi:hypothetical protein
MMTNSTSTETVHGDSFESAWMEGAMKGIRFGTNVAIFLLFFGVAALEAFQSGSWLKAAFWAAIGIVFLLADNFRKSPVGDTKRAL